jgi:hypothetical protein
MAEPPEDHANHDEIVRLAELAALQDRHARYVLGYAHALPGSREQAEEVSLEVLLTGWRAGLAHEPDQFASRLLLMGLVRREVVVLRRRRATPTAPRAATILEQRVRPRRRRSDISE